MQFTPKIRYNSCRPNTTVYANYFAVWKHLPSNLSLNLFWSNMNDPFLSLAVDTSILSTTFVHACCQKPLWELFFPLDRRRFAFVWEKKHKYIQGPNFLTRSLISRMRGAQKNRTNLYEAPNAITFILLFHRTNAVKIWGWKNIVADENNLELYSDYISDVSLLGPGTLTVFFR